MAPGNCGAAAEHRGSFYKAKAAEIATKVNSNQNEMAAARGLERAHKELFLLAGR